VREGDAEDDDDDDDDDDGVVVGVVGVGLAVRPLVFVLESWAMYAAMGLRLVPEV
jgi:hypothetical protein